MALDLKPRRLVSYAVALVALAVIAWLTPLRDRCEWSGGAARAIDVAVSRDAAGCVLHARSGDVHIDREACARLQCRPGLVSTFARCDLAMTVGLFVLSLVSSLAWSARWNALLAFAGVRLRTREAWRITLEAQAAGVLLPGGVGGDALRVASVLASPGRRGAATSTVIASVLLDRVMGLSLVATAAVALSVATGGVGSPATVWLLLAFPAGALVVIGIARGTAGSAPRRLGAKFAAAFDPVLAYLRDPRAPRALGTAMAFGLFVAGSQLAITRGLVSAIGGAPSSERWIFVGTAMSFVVAAVPALPGGWGTTDAAYVFFFGRAGLSEPQALAVCLLNRLFWYLSAVVGAALLAQRGRGVRS